MNTICGQKVRFHCSCDPLGQNSSVAPWSIFENTFSNTAFILVFLSQRGLGGIRRRVIGEGNSNPLQLLLPGKSHGWRNLVGCRPWGLEEWNTTERLHFSLSYTGEGNGNPLQCSCLENSRDGGAWWAAIYGVAQSRTRLKRLSSSSSSLPIHIHRMSFHLLV